ncbi:IS1595 family transposase [Pseudomonas sp. GG8]
MFPAEGACLEYLSLVRWPDGYVCPICSSKKHWKKARGLFACGDCSTLELSVTAGTLFQDTHKPLRLWFQAMWYVVNQKNGVSALGLQKALGLGSYQTAWARVRRKSRRAMVRPGRERLSGLVEVDEVFIGGKRSGKGGRGAEGKSLIFMAVEDVQGHVGRIRLERCPTLPATLWPTRLWKQPIPEAAFVQMTGTATTFCRATATVISPWRTRF